VYAPLSHSVVYLFFLLSPSLSFLHVTLGVPEGETFTFTACSSALGHLFTSQEDPISTFHVAIPLKIVIPY